MLCDLENALAVTERIGTLLAENRFAAFDGHKFFATGDALRLSYLTETLSVLSAVLYAVNADGGMLGNQEEEDGKRIWRDLNNGRCSVWRKPERQKDSCHGRFGRNWCRDCAVSGRAWSAGCRCGAGSDESKSSDCSRAQGR